MAIFDLEDEQRNLVIGVGIGMGLLMLLKEFAPAFAGVGRPLAKATIKSGIMVVDKSREKLAQFRETYEDLVAEVKAEMQQELQANGETAPEPPAEPGREGGQP